MAYHGNPYTSAEDEIITRGYERGDMLPQIAARLPGRSIYSISSRAILIGLRHPNKTRNQNARRGPFALEDYQPAEPPTLHYVPYLDPSSKYRMVRPA